MLNPLNPAHRSRLDAFACAAVGSLMAGFVPIGAGFLIASVWNGPSWQIALAAALLFWSSAAGLWFVLTSWKVFANNHPRGPVIVAVLQPRLPALLRPVAGLWWGYQSLLALFWGLMLEILERQMPWLERCLLAATASSLSYLTFGFLLLATTAFTKRTAVVRRLWRWRGYWTAGHAVLVLLVGLVLDLIN